MYRKMFPVKQNWLAEIAFHVKQIRSAKTSFHVKQIRSVKTSFHVKQALFCKTSFHVEQEFGSKQRFTWNKPRQFPAVSRETASFSLRTRYRNDDFDAFLPLLAPPFGALPCFAEDAEYLFNRIVEGLQVVQDKFAWLYGAFAWLW